jgi:nucleoid DNA-binding protein
LADARRRRPRDDRAKRGDLLDALAERSPMRRADLKVAMELVLEEMGKLLDAGDELVLPPLGKLIGQETGRQRGGGDMLTVKLRRLPGDGTAGGDPDTTHRPDASPAPRPGDIAPCEAREGWLNRADPAGD